MVDKALREFRRQLGRRVKVLRKARRWSQDQLGERAKLTGKFIGEVERGDKGITLDSLYSLAKALGVPLREIIDVESAEGKAGAREMDQVLALFRSQPKPQEIRRALRVLRALLEEP